MRTSELLGTSSLCLPVDSYIYSVVTITGNASIAAIASDDSLRIFDPQTLQLISGSIFGKVQRNVTCLKNLDGNAGTSSLVTAGRDATETVRCWDPRTGKQSLELSHGMQAAFVVVEIIINEKSGPDAPYLALGCKNGKIAVGSELTHSQATIAAWDCRSPQKPFVQYVECHNDDVTELSFHPSNSAYLISGSTDGLVNILDTTITDEDDALLQVVNHGSSIHHAGVLSHSKLYALSHDETLSVYPLETSDAGDLGMPSPQVLGDLRPKLDCDYVAEVVFSGEGVAALAAGSHSKQHLDLLPLRFASDWVLDFDRSIRLPGAHGEEIVRSVCFDHSEQTIFTGGEDGLIKAWRMPGTEAAVTPMAEDPKEAKTRQRKGTSGNSEGRFKPY